MLYVNLRHVDFDFVIHLYVIHPIQRAAIATTSDAMATPVSIPGLNPPEDEPPPLLLLTFPPVLVDSDIGAAAVAAGEVEPVAVLTFVEVAIVVGVVSAGADAGTYPACEQ
jgi:hypothetical protein